MPLIAITADGSVAIDRKYVVRFNYTSQQYARELMKYLQGCGYKKIGIVEAEIPYFQSIIQGMKSSLGDGQTLEVSSSLQPSESDFRSIIPALRQKNYDAVGVFLVTGQISQFYQQASQLKFAAPFFGTDFFESKSEIKEAGKSIEGTVYPSINIEDDFRTRYTSRFGNDLQVSYAGNAYDAAMLVARSLKKTPYPLNPDVLIKQLIQESYAGVSGNYTFVTSAEGAGFDPTLVIKRIDSGEVSVAGACHRKNE